MAITDIIMGIITDMKKAANLTIRRNVNRLNDNKGISIILAIIIIIVLGLAGSIFAYLMSSGSINSRADLLSAEAKYAAKSGIELTLYELEPNHYGVTQRQPLNAGCPTRPVVPSGVPGTPNLPYQYLWGNLQGNLQQSVNFTPTFCAVVGKFQSPGPQKNCTYYIITSNGFAGGAEREITAKVGISKGNNGNCTGIYVETELPNSQQ